MAMEHTLLYAPHSNKHPYITCTTGTRHTSVDSPAIVPQRSIAYHVKLKNYFCPLLSCINQQREEERARCSY
jgi:hypothetical protein